MTENMQMEAADIGEAQATRDAQTARHAPPVERVAFVIWSGKHRAWWAPNREGYNTALRCAGVYSEEEAREIARGWAPEGQPTVAMPLADALEEHAAPSTRAGSVGALIDGGLLG